MKSFYRVAAYSSITTCLTYERTAHAKSFEKHRLRFVSNHNSENTGVRVSMDMTSLQPIRVGSAVLHTSTYEIRLSVAFPVYILLCFAKR